MLTLPTPAELRSARVRLGLTQAQLAEAAGVSQSLVARIEGGGVDARYSTLAALVDALNRFEGARRRAVDVMTAEVRSLAPDDLLVDAARLMRETGISQLPVLESGSSVGALSERDVLHALAAREPGETARLTVGEVMRPPFPAVAPGEDLASVRRTLEEHPAVLVLERGELKGIVTRTDLLVGF